MVLDKVVYNNAISISLSDNSNFTKLQSDLTLHREGQLQSYLRKLKKEGLLGTDDDDKLY